MLRKNKEPFEQGRVRRQVAALERLRDDVELGVVQRERRPGEPRGARMQKGVERKQRRYSVYG